MRKSLPRHEKSDNRNRVMTSPHHFQLPSRRPLLLYRLVADDFVVQRVAFHGHAAVARQSAVHAHPERGGWQSLTLFAAGSRCHLRHYSQTQELILRGY